MANEVKKVDPKVVEKAEVVKATVEALAEAGFEIVSNEGSSIFVRMANCDIELKAIAKKERIEA